jgi:hypothetical protein
MNGLRSKNSVYRKIVLFRASLTVLFITNNLEMAGALYTVLAQYHDKLVGLG